MSLPSHSPPKCLFWGSWQTKSSLKTRRKLEKQLQTFGARAHRLRNQRGMAQEKLAELTDRNIRTVQKIEAGQTNILTTTAARIQKALACDWRNLMSI
ncbi:MAG: helix-turn-helix transcriptional regulator [Kiritimatiellia bacterium]|nr:helix-turn-helix transcriptional regulator [Kiritimatiellia bacterium]